MGRLRQKDCCEFQVRLDFIVRCGLKETTKKRKRGRKEKIRPTKGKVAPRREPANPSGNHNHGDNRVDKVRRSLMIECIKQL